MNRFAMSVILPLAVLACVALLIASVGTLFLALGKNNAVFAALAFVVVIMIVASLLNLKKSDAAEGQHGGGR